MARRDSERDTDTSGSGECDTETRVLSPLLFGTPSRAGIEMYSAIWRMLGRSSAWRVIGIAVGVMVSLAVFRE